VQIHVVGEAVPGSIIQTEVNSVSLEAEATHIPTGIDVSVEGLEIGSRINAGDLILPTGSTLAIDEEALVLHLTAAPTAEQLESELAEAEAEAGIEHDAPVDADTEVDADAEAEDGEAQESTESE